MKPTLFGIRSMVVASTLAAFSAYPKDSANETPHLTVRVMDYVGLTPETRGEMEINAKRILRNAGIAIDFITCYRGAVETGGEVCAGPLGPAHLVLRIFQPKFAAKRTQLGYAAMTREGGVYITVFINPVQMKARVGDLSNGALLGHAVTHEIGHLLLGADSHSPAGIMRPVWRVVDEEWMAKGALLFDASQGRTMRASLVRRGSGMVADFRLSGSGPL